MTRPTERRYSIAAVRRLEGLALLYITVPNALFKHGWIVAPLGSIAAVVLLFCVVWTIVRTAPGRASPPLEALCPIVFITVTPIYREELAIEYPIVARGRDSRNHSLKQPSRRPWLERFIRQPTIP